MRVSVSVVVPTYNRRDSLLRCVGSISHDVQVVVVDDGSTDGTEQALKELGLPNLVYLRQTNKGPASARNLGIKETSGDYVAFTDDDCVPAAGWPWPLLEAISAGDEEVAGVGGRVLPLRTGLFAAYYTFHRILEPPRSCSYLVTANCLYTRKALEEVGGFDERIRGPGGEDPALSAKVRDKGHRLAYAPTAIVRHDYREGLIDFVRTFYRYGRGCAHVVG